MYKKIIYKSGTGLANLVYLTSVFMGKNRNTLSVLCYHSISNSKEEYSIKLEMVEQQIEKILKFAKFVSLDQVIDVVKGGKIKTPAVSLTVDDGYEDVMKILPLTKKYKIPVTLFILSDINHPNRKELNNNSKLLTVKQLKKLISEGWKIGCHSATHPDFHNLSETQIKGEIIDSKRNLESKLGIKIDYFAYPKGSYTEEILQTVKEAGYKAAFAVRPGSIKQGINKWILPRTVISKSHDLSYFPAVFSESTYSIRDRIDSFNLWGRVMR